MKYIKLIGLSSFVFLTGCSFHGVMPQSYDGEAIEHDDAAIEAYVESGQVLNVNVNRYPFVESDSLVGIVDVIDLASSGEGEAVEAGSFNVPEDLEAGMYHLEISRDVSSSAVVVYDEDDVRVFETSLLGQNGLAQVMLDDGYRLEFKTRYGTLNVTPVEVEMIEAHEDVLYMPQGMYVVGEHIDAGEYELITEELLLTRGDGTPEVYWNSYGETYEYVMERTMSDDYRPEELKENGQTIAVELHGGDIIIAEKYLVLSTSGEGGE